MPTKAHRFGDIDGVHKLPERVRRELEEFFHAAVALEDKELRIEGWEGPQAAARLVEEAVKGAAK